MLFPRIQIMPLLCALIAVGIPSERQSFCYLTTLKTMSNLRTGLMPGKFVLLMICLLHYLISFFQNSSLLRKSCFPISDKENSYSRKLKSKIDIQSHQLYQLTWMNHSVVSLFASPLFIGLNFQFLLPFPQFYSHLLLWNGSNTFRKGAGANVRYNQ